MNYTVRAFVKTAFKEEVGQMHMHICMGPDCEVGYFDVDSDTIIGTDSLKRPIWFKTGADPVIGCYCKSVKEEEIIAAVVETGLTDFQFLMMHLRGSLGNNCAMTNPRGYCCNDAVMEMVEKGEKVRGILMGGMGNDDFMAIYGNLKVGDIHSPPELPDGAGCGCSCSDSDCCGPSDDSCK